MRPEWFPDWEGLICAIVGGGPSVTPGEVDTLRGRVKTIVINRSYELASWADVLYAADRQFWDVFCGVPGFAGIKVTQDMDAATHFELRRVRLVEQNSDIVDSISLDAGILARGGHGGHQALNLAIQFGARRIMLLGYDCDGEHWHGRHEAPLRNARPKTLDQWRARIDALAPMLGALGVDVVNCSRQSKLTAYRKVDVKEAIEQWTRMTMAA